MATPDYIVLFGYFIVMIVIGVVASWKVKAQEDYFMGGRGFGKLLQTFAAFGAGTGAQDPINVGSKTWTSGLSGVWSALMWLFVTPFYWIFAVWYRRMRHLTLGDWFVERYQSKALGVAYTLFGFTFCTLYLSTMFTGIAKVATPLLGDELVLSMVGMIGSENPEHLKFVMVPVIAVVVLAYGILGGLTAAYWTDLIQGLCIIALSLILIPTGLHQLVDKYGEVHGVAEGTGTMMDGFRIMHERVPSESFQLFGGSAASEFPLHFIISLSLLGLVGIVVQPHFIAVGGGSAKTELTARIGLVTGNFLKRFCTIGWAITGLIVVALLAGNLELAKDPERAWGVASREILGPLGIGLVGLMLACLLAALMSTADCFMLVTSALLVRNVYAAYIDKDATEKKYVIVGRLAGFVLIGGAVLSSLLFYQVFAQYQMALEVAAVFAAPFWIGMFWRRATKWAAWLTICFSLALFVVAPRVTPMLMPQLKSAPAFAITNDIVITETRRKATVVDVAKREAQIKVYDEQAKKGVKGQGERPTPIVEGEETVDLFKSGGKPIFWSTVVEMGYKADTKDKKKPSLPDPVVVDTNTDGNVTVTRLRYTEGVIQGEGKFNPDFLIYIPIFNSLGWDLRSVDDAMLGKTMRLPLRMFLPLLTMVLFSLVTPRDDKEKLDRYYVKMKTPVNPDHEIDAAELEKSYKDPQRFDDKKLFPGSSLEILRPTMQNVVGFMVSVGICGLFVWLAITLATIGS